MKLKQLTAAILSIFGVTTPVSVFAQHINSVEDSTPIVLQHSQDFQLSRSLIADYHVKDNDKVDLYHYSHASHYSHSSHSSHRSHYSSSF